MLLYFTALHGERYKNINYLDVHVYLQTDKTIEGLSHNLFHYTLFMVVYCIWVHMLLWSMILMNPLDATIYAEISHPTNIYIYNIY